MEYAHWYAHVVNVIGEVTSGSQEATQEVAIGGHLPLGQCVDLVWIHADPLGVNHSP